MNKYYLYLIFKLVWYNDNHTNYMLMNNLLNKHFGSVQPCDRFEKAPSSCHIKTWFSCILKTSCKSCVGSIFSIFYRCSRNLNIRNVNVKVKSDAVQLIAKEDFNITSSMFKKNLLISRKKYDKNHIGNKLYIYRKLSDVKKILIYSLKVHPCIDLFIC